MNAFRVTIGRRNLYATPCVDCRRLIPPDGGELLAKAPHEKWRVICDGCAYGDYRPTGHRYRPGGATPPPRPNPRPSSTPTCLAILGLAPPVTADDIRRAFRAKALETHPDRGGDAAEFIAARRARDEALRLVGTTA